MECPICFNNFNDDVRLLCNHKLCTNCFNEIIKKNMLKCPLCRGNIEYYYIDNEKIRLKIINNIKILVPYVRIPNKYIYKCGISMFMLGYITSSITSYITKNII